MPVKESPLLEAHRRLGAKLTDFAGWQMPLQYRGVIAEHTAVRTSAGLFDVSHLGKLRVRGEGAEAALQEALTADIAALETGRASYALVLNEAGGCIDDVFVYRLGPDVFLVVPNAANVDRVADSIRMSGASPEDEWGKWAILALQGPDSFEMLEKVWPGHPATNLPMHGWCRLDEGREAGGMIARTGYTGERGFELYVSASNATRVWEDLLNAGAVPAGLGARDTLRLEMGYALHGHELSEDINPLEARLGWALAWETDFRGRAALGEIKERGPDRRLFGVRCTDRGVPRAGFAVEREGQKIGELTSGNFSPTLSTGIGLALGPSQVAPEPGEAAEIVGPNRHIRGDIVKPPFVKQSGR
jgi:aminomethyltransferase